MINDVRTSQRLLSIGQRYTQTYNEDSPAITESVRAEEVMVQVATEMM